MTRAFTLLVLLACAAPLRADEGVAPATSASGFTLDPTRELAYRGEDPAFELRLRGLLALDYRGYDERNVRASQGRLDRALLGAEGELLDALSFRLLADLRGTDTAYGLEEGWLSYTIAPWLRVTGGLLKIAPGVEHSLPEETLPFVDYGFQAFRTGSYDLGLRVEGELGEGLLSYDLVATGGEGFDLFGQRRDGRQLTGRVASYPFRWLDIELPAGPYRLPLLSGLFLSGGYSYHHRFRGQLDVATSLRNKVFVTGRLVADEYSFWTAGYGIDFGPFRLIHETTRASLVNLRAPGGEASLRGQFTVWQVSFSWRITGEPYDSRPFRQRARDQRFPAAPLYDFETGAWGPGALEVAVRYSNTEYDRELVELGVTNPTTSSQEARAFEVALAWWPWRTLRASFQVTRVIADEFPGVFDSHGRDTSFALRLQVDF